MRSMDMFILIGGIGDAWVSARTLGLMLWGGLAVLTLALVILTPARVPCVGCGRTTHKACRSPAAVD